MQMYFYAGIDTRHKFI